MLAVNIYISLYPYKQKQNIIMTTYKKLFGTCIKSKKEQIYIHYVPNQQVRILQTNFFAKFGSSACQGSLQHVKDVQFLDPPSQMSKNQLKLYKHIIKCQKK